jgi:hypothetical protein
VQPGQGGRPGRDQDQQNDSQRRDPRAHPGADPELAPAQLRELAVQLAADPDLTVSVITYDDGRAELEVLHTGPPHRTEHTIDCCRFEREPAAAPARTMSVATQSAMREAAEMIRAILRDARHGTG